jgi:site-specific DNA-cytosine methylase
MELEQMTRELAQDDPRRSMHSNVHPLRVLVACEYSGTVRDAFAARGHHAMSCDILPTDKPGNHYQGDVRDVLDDGWDLMICHPPCTYLSVSGIHWNNRGRGWEETEKALDFVRMLMGANIPCIALENPVSIISSRIRKPDQIVQPWQFGHMEQKATCLWLKNLPMLKPTSNVKAEMMKLPDNERQRIHYLPPSKDRWKLRSTTYQGIADAMADQWENAIGM